jgi:hypothetical protein
MSREHGSAKEDNVPQEVGHAPDKRQPGTRRQPIGKSFIEGDKANGILRRLNAMSCPIQFIHGHYQRHP